MKQFYMTPEGPALILDEHIILWDGRDASKLKHEDFTDAMLQSMITNNAKLKRYAYKFDTCKSCRPILKEVIYINWKELMLDSSTEEDADEKKK